MGRTEDLEDELRANWNERTLAVYSDHLQSLGDPRGELISLDLRDGDVEARRGELLRAWFAPLEVWWDKHDHCWYAGDHRGGTTIAFERGFVEAVLDGNDVSTLLRFLKHPACTYLQRLSVSASSVAMRAALSALARREHHWLGALALRRDEYDDDLIRRDTADLVAATPCLELLDVAGRRVLGELDHPTVRELVLTGHDAIELTDKPMASVITLDFAFEPGSAAAENGVGSYVSAKRFPSLRRLRLSRVDGPVFASLSQLDILPRLSHLELSPLRERWDIRHVQAALDRMPILSELAFSRAYSLLGDLGADLHHRSARIHMPPPVTWPPADHPLSTNLLVEDIEIYVPDMIRSLEDQFDSLPDEVQEIWLRFWDEVYSANLVYGSQTEKHFPADQLARALDAVQFEDQNQLDVLRSHLLRCTPYEVRVRRVG